MARPEERDPTQPAYNTATIPKRPAALGAAVEAGVQGLRTAIPAAARAEAGAREAVVNTVTAPVRAGVAAAQQGVGGIAGGLAANAMTSGVSQSLGLPRQPTAPAPSFGQRAGAVGRVIADGVTAQAQEVGRAATAYPRFLARTASDGAARLGEFATDVQAGFTGRPSMSPSQASAAAATEPVERAAASPSAARPRKLGVGASAASADPANVNAGPPAMAPAIAVAQPPPPPAAAAVAARAAPTGAVGANLNAGPPTAAAEMFNPSPNTFVGSNTGIRNVDPVSGAIGAGPGRAMPTAPTVAAAPAPAPAPVPQAMPVPQRPSVAQPAQARAERMATNTGSSLNPNSTEFELRRRAENAAMSSFGTSMSRSRAQADLLAEGAGIRGGIRDRALAAEQGATSLAGQELQEAGASDRALLEQTGATTRAMLEDSGATTRAGISDTGATLRSGMGIASQEREGAAARAQRPTMQLADGTIGLVGQDGTMQPVLGADGQPVRAARPTTPGQITPEQRFNAYSSERQAIENSMLRPEDKAARLSALEQDPRFAEIFGGQAAAPPSPSIDDFLAAARPLNPGMSDADLRAQYAQRYGR